MYCGACAGDMAVARAVAALGHEMTVLPLYMPLRVEGDKSAVNEQVFLGGINAWLQQVWPGFRRLPRFMDRALDSPALLNGISGFAIRTKPSNLGPMTVSVLQGKDGRQRAELDRLVEFLQSQAPPDLISITNSLLSGMAPALREHFDVPIICGVQGEDTFLHGMPERYRDQSLALVRENAAAIDLFVAPCDSYAAKMGELLEVERERMTVVRPGLDVAAYRGWYPRQRPRPREPFTVGYLSVIIPRKGLHLLVEAVGRLVAEGRDVRLAVAGKPLDRAYWREVRRDANRELGDSFEFLGEVDLAGKIEFLHRISAFCQPSVVPEVRGMTALEAMAAGAPIVTPNEGVFPELLESCGGGVGFRSGDAESLAQAIAGLMDEPDAADAMGESGRAGVAELHSEEVAGARMLEVCLTATAGSYPRT